MYGGYIGWTTRYFSMGNKLVLQIQNNQGKAIYIQDLQNAYRKRKKRQIQKSLQKPKPKLTQTPRYPYNFLCLYMWGNKRYTHPQMSQM